MQEEADRVMVVRWNTAAMTDENEQAAETLLAELAKERAHLDAECTRDKVFQKAA